MNDLYDLYDQYRQGDVLVVRRTTQPVEGLIESPGDDRCVLKRGEATGHAHALPADDGYVVSTTARARHLRIVRTTARVRHEEHDPITLPAGYYDLPEQVEWTDEDEPRVVED